MLLRALLALFLLSAPLSAGEVTVFAASSLKDALEEVAASWRAETGHEVRLVLAGSSTLARQIEQGAPADLFVSANAAWMDRLEAKGLLAPDSRFDLAGNMLSLIGHGQRAPLDLRETDLAAYLATEGRGARIASALTEAVPAGIYAREALISIGQWEALRDHLAETKSVRAALALVASGAAPLGIVYASDARAEPRVSALAVFPAGSHGPITYPAARLARSTAPEAARLLAYLASPDTAEILRAHGFTPPPGAAR